MLMRKAFVDRECKQMNNLILVFYLVLEPKSPCIYWIPWLHAMVLNMNYLIQSVGLSYLQLQKLNIRTCDFLSQTMT